MAKDIEIEYAKYIDEYTVSLNIPKEVTFEGRVYVGDLTQYPDVLRSLDFYPIEDSGETPEVVPAKKHLEARYAFDSENEKILRSWVLVDDPPRNLSLSKRKLMNSFKALGIWTQVKAFLEANDYWDDFDTATTLDEQEEMMQNAIVALKTAFSLSEEDVENIITNSVVD